MSQLAPRPKYPSAKFDVVGITYSGRVAEPTEDRQARNFNTNEPKYWPDGNPVMQTRIVLDPGNGGDRFAIYAQGRMAQAIRQALAEAQAGDVEVGGVLTVKFDHLEPSKQGAQPAKCFTATYTLPPAQSPGSAVTSADPWDDIPPEPPYDEPPF